MATDKEIALRVLDFQARARNYPLMEIPGYMKWSERKISEGESPVLIAHLDATGMILLPEEVSTITEVDFEDMLADLKVSIGE